MEDRETNSVRDTGYDDNDYENMDTPGKENNNKINSFNISCGNKDNENDTNTKKCFNLNELECLINILASTLGVGAFVFPSILYQLGIITSLMLLFFVSASVYYSVDILRRFVVDSKNFSFSDITQKTLGNLWLKIYAVSAFLFYMSCIVNYSDLIYDYSKSILNSLGEGFLKIIFFVIMCTIEIILCIFTSELSKLYFLSLIVIVIFFIILLVSIINSIIVMVKDKNDETSFQFKFALFTIENKYLVRNPWNDFIFIMSKIIEIFYGFIYHSTFPTLLHSLKDVNKTNSKKIQNVSYTIINIIYIFILFFGFSFYDNDKNTIIFTEIDENQIPITFLRISFKIILIILFLTLIPIRYIVIRDNYTSLICMKEVPLKYEIIITSICLIINNTVVYFIGDSSNFITKGISYFGGIFGVFISFVLPVLSFMAFFGKTQNRTIFGYFIVGIFIFIGFFTIFYNIKLIIYSQ